MIQSSLIIIICKSTFQAVVTSKRLNSFHNSSLESILASSNVLSLNVFSRARALGRREDAAVSVDDLAINLCLLFIGGIGKVNGNFFAEVLGDFFQGKAGSFGPEEVDD